VKDPRRRKPLLCYVKHKWDVWTYDAATKCDQSRACNRCGQTKSRMQHVWSAWEYVAHLSCDQRRRCARCGEAEERQQHEWGAWTRLSSRTCDCRRVCVRCGAEEEALRHDYVRVMGVRGAGGLPQGGNLWALRGHEAVVAEEAPVGPVGLRVAEVLHAGEVLPALQQAQAWEGRALLGGRGCRA